MELKLLQNEKPKQNTPLLILYDYWHIGKEATSCCYGFYKDDVIFKVEIQETGCVADMLIGINIQWIYMNEAKEILKHKELRCPNTKLPQEC